MYLKSYYNPQNYNIRLIFLGFLILPFHSLTALLIFVFVSYKIWRQNYQQIVNDNLSKSIFLLSILLALSSTLANNIEDAWLGMPLFIPFFLVFLALRILIVEYKYLYFIVLPIIFNSLLVIFFGVAELKFGWVSSDFLYIVLGWQLTGGGEPVGRLASVFPYANLVGLYFVIVIILAIALLIERASKQIFNQLDWFLIITIILNGISLGLTNSRNAWIICFLSLIVFTIYLGWYWILRLLTLGAMLVAGASFGNFPGQNLLRKIVPSFLWERFSDQAYPDRPIATLRITQWDFCLDLISDRPFWGWGLRNFSTLYEEKMTTYLGHPHNFFLMLGAEAGLINLVILVLIITWILSRGCLAFIVLKKNAQEPIILLSFLMVIGACVCYNLVDVSLFDFRSNAIAWIFLAAISGISEKILKQEKNTKKQKKLC